jgi:hypothetical protein
MEIGNLQTQPPQNLARLTARYIEMIGDARAKSVDYVLMTIGAFAGEPDVLYVALDYAYHSGVGVTMAERPPKSEQ